MSTRQTRIREAVEHLTQADPVLARLIEAVGPFTLRTHRDRFDLLARSILSQQLSTKAARTIRERLLAELDGSRLCPQAICSLPTARLRKAGLSQRKAEYLRELAENVVSGRLPLHRLGRLPDEEVIERLVEIRGIGVWTAQMFLIFALGRLDVFPADDLGIRVAIRDLYGLEELPQRATSQRIADPWRPFRSVASWYLWRSRDGTAATKAKDAGYPV